MEKVTISAEGRRALVRVADAVATWSDVGATDGGSEVQERQMAVIAAATESHPELEVALRALAADVAPTASEMVDRACRALARLVDWGSALALGHRAVLESLVERLWARGRREDVERIRDLLRRGSSASKRDDAGDHLAKLQPPAAKPKRKPTIKPASAQAGLGA